MDDMILVGKLILWFIVLLFIALLLGHTEISINPFYVKVTAWRTAIGWMMLFIGISLITYDIKKESWNEGYEDAMKEVNKVAPSNKLELEVNEDEMKGT